MHNHKCLYHDDSSHILYNESISNICKQMNHIQVRRADVPNARLGFAHHEKSFSPIIKELTFWQRFWERASAECTTEAEAWLSEGVPADIQLQPTQRHCEKG